jgi:hypothetical protein
MHFKLRLIPTAVATLLVAACGGGGGGGGDATSVAAGPAGGTLVDGYLNFAKVVCDVNENGAYDPGEPVTYTSNTGDGKFTFNPGCTHSTLGGVDGTGTNADTKLPFVGLLRAPPGASVITPLTTLLAAGMTAAEIATALDLPAGTDLLNVDPAATNTDGSLKDASLLKKTLAVQQLLQKTTEMVNGLAGMTGSVSTAAVYTQVANALATTLKGGVVLISGGATPVMDVSVVNTMLSAAVTSIASASTVDASVKTALANAGGAATLPTVINAALTSQAQALLSSADNAITATVLDRQSNSSITDTVTAAAKAGTLSPTASAADLAAVKTTTTTEAAKPTVVVTSHVPDPAAGSTTLFTFDEATPGFVGMGAYGGALPTVEAGASSDAGNALKVVKPTGGEVWGGIYFGTARAIAFAAGQKKITAAVYSTRANALIKFKVEATDKTSVEVVGTSTGAANTWSTVTWDLADVDTSKVYSTIAITPDADVVASGQTYYFDNIALAPAGAVPPAVVPKAGVLASFDEASPLVFAGFGGAEGSSIKAGPTGGTGNALNVLRTGGQVYAGATVTVGPMALSATNTTFTARVYSPLAGVPMVLKLENPDASISSGDIQATETVVVGWQTLSWVVPSAKLSTAYTKVVLLPHLGTLASVSPGESFFFDDITLGAAISSSPAPTPTPTPTPTPSNYLYVPNNAIGFSPDGTTASTVNYSMATFQSSGINVKWPMANGAAIKLNLAENGTFNIASGQTLSAAVQIEDTAGGSGQIRAYTDGVTVNKSGSSITLTVPNLPQALIYGVSGDGNTKAVINFASSVRGISNVLSTAANAISTVMFGEVVNFGITGLSNDFTNMSALRGTYKVTIVVTQLPLRQADGTVFGTKTIEMPTSVSGGVASGIVPVTGPGLVGYINLTN